MPTSPPKRSSNYKPSSILPVGTFVFWWGWCTEDSVDKRLRAWRLKYMSITVCISSEPILSNTDLWYSYKTVLT